MSVESLYLSLFLSSFIAATLIPAFSEAGFAAALTLSEANPALLFLAVTSGNTLGACVNWWLGARLHQFRTKRWFPFNAKTIEAASARFQRYGRWSLLFAWLPIVGDPLTFAAGLLKTPFKPFLLFVAIGKAARYGAIWAATLWFVA